jgi:hypothetical protein
MLQHKLLAHDEDYPLLNARVEGVMDERRKTANTYVLSVQVRVVLTLSVVKIRYDATVHDRTN